MSRSAADQLRLDQIHNMPCICCVKYFVLQPSRTEAHHIVDCGYRKHSGGDQSTIPLCGWHHRAQCLPKTSIHEMLNLFGPSLEYQGEKGAFDKEWGNQQELLARVNELLGEV